MKHPMNLLLLAKAFIKNHGKRIFTGICDLSNGLRPARFGAVGV